jgi:hypothetical protein
VLTGDYLLDIYRVISSKSHRYDWAMHCLGVPELSGDKPLASLGEGRGYDQISQPVQLPRGGRIRILDWRLEKRHRRWVLWTPPGRDICMGIDPSYAQAEVLGHTAPLPPVFSLLAREQAREAVFVSLCSWRPAADLRLEVVGRGQAQGDVSVRVFGEQTGIVWKFPYKGEIQCLSPQRRR